MPRKLPEQCASSLRAGLDDSERIADWGAFSIASEALGLAIGSPFTVFVSLSLSDSRKEETMPQPQHYDFLILGSGQGGKRLAWHLAGSGHRVVGVERPWVGGSCPPRAWLPSKNERDLGRARRPSRPPRRSVRHIDRRSCGRYGEGSAPQAGHGRPGDRLPPQRL